MTGRIIMEFHMTLLHTKYTSLRFKRSRFFFKNFHHKPMADNDTPVWTLGAWLARFIKKSTIHCYTQNMKALGLLVSEKIF